MLATISFTLLRAADSPTDSAAKAHTPEIADRIRAFRDARFGLFIHWGLYSFAEAQWRGSLVSEKGPWKGKGFSEFLQLQAQIPIAEYEEFARGFRPAAFVADAWVRDAKAAGMRYLVLTAKHHEGFAMFKSPSHPFNILDHSGFGRDPVAELAAACRRGGLLFGVYYSLGRDWHDPDAPTNWPTKGGRSNTWDFPDEDAKIFDRYFRRKVLPQVRELLTQYGPIDLLWFDTPEGIKPAQSRELLELIRTLQPACVVNDRIGNKLGDFTTYEQKVPPAPISNPWETCATLGRNWGYNPRDTKWKSPELIVRLLTDVVSKNGNLLFNIGPRGDGSWPDGAAAQLKPVGDWLKVNGSAIYGARSWTIAGEGGADDKEHGGTAAEATQDTVKNEISYDVIPDVRFTVGADGVLNVIVRSWKEPRVAIRALGLAHSEGFRASRVTLLGAKEPVVWNQTAEALEINVPAKAAHELPVWVFQVAAESASL